MEVGVRVEAENLQAGAIRHTATAYLTFVALGEDGRPSTVPPLPLKTEAEQRRNREAHERRKQRLEAKNRKKTTDPS
jgi:acyl-CoA hydrolase